MAYSLGSTGQKVEENRKKVPSGVGPAGMVEHHGSAQPRAMELLHPKEGLGSTSVSRETKLQSSDPDQALS